MQIPEDDGIYFDLPEDDYHKIERLSNSGICSLRISGADWWVGSWLNPDKEEEELTDARLLGRAYHCARLEPEHFEARYCRKPDKADFADVEGFLSTSTDIEKALADRGLPKSSKEDGGVLGKARRLRESGYGDPIWHIIEAEAVEERGDRQEIAGPYFDQIIRDTRWFNSAEQVANRLSGGQAEVSILWTCPETGIKMKARIDYLRADQFVDLKTFANPQGKGVHKCIIDAIMYNRYFIQPAVYLEAITTAQAEKLPIQGEATEAQKQLIEELYAREEDIQAWLIFVQKGVPNILEREYAFWQVPLEVQAMEVQAEQGVEEMRDRLKAKTGLYYRACQEIDAAKRTFRAYNDIYEPGEPWIPYELSGQLHDEDFPPYWLERGFEG